MLNSTEDAASRDRLHKISGEFGGDSTQVIHTDKSGEISKKDLDIARKAVRQVDDEKSPIFISAFGARPRWNVQRSVVSASPLLGEANILPEQTIGRGLRLMFRDVPTDYTERVDIIGNKAFLSSSTILKNSKN